MTAISMSTIILIVLILFFSVGEILHEEPYSDPSPVGVTSGT